ncbi:nitroreductase/quinone reductase family protein [Actinokineospora enzanensis]|uniref:nitroreductase/quinone reductase family protein n=1 Tax=Actinokineospora enzanensis TaxID=155975 RepID=UPI00037E72A5|nr:nitroreductase/quinone reductase family protein [Actinokineospora enzanensis]
MPNDFNQSVIDEFRANRGRVGGYFEGGRLLLLTTIGARTGERHTTPLGYLTDETGSRVFVIASAGGSPKNPDWYHNVLADPAVTIEDGIFTHPARASVLAGAERDEVFARAVEADPGWLDYESRSGRALPVVALAVRPGPPTAGSLGETLVLLHDWFRRELELIRAEIVRSGAVLGAQLRINCLVLCQGLGNHHQGEDQALFPMIARQHPELADVVTRLGEEHAKVAETVDRLRDLLRGRDTATLLPEFDRLAAELTAHLSYEEEQLLPALS